MSVVSLIDTAGVWLKCFFFSWDFCWFWLEFLSRFFRLVGFCLLTTLVCNLSLQKFEPILLVLTRHWKRLAWLTSQYLNYAFPLQVSIDFFSKRKFDNILCLSGGQYFIIWSLKFKGYCSTSTQFPFANYHLLCCVLTFPLPEIIICFINKFILFCQ